MVMTFVAITVSSNFLEILARLSASFRILVRGRAQHGSLLFQPLRGIPERKAGHTLFRPRHERITAGTSSQQTLCYMNCCDPPVDTVIAMGIFGDRISAAECHAIRGVSALVLRACLRT